MSLRGLGSGFIEIGYDIIRCYQLKIKKSYTFFNFYILNFRQKFVKNIFTKFV